MSYATHDAGLGTAYERLAVYGLLERWFRQRPVKTVLEGPVDAMAGIPGLHLVGLARLGCEVTVALPSAEALETVRRVYALLGVADRLRTVEASAERLPEGGFDLVLTYNALPVVSAWQGYLARVAQRARKYLVVSVTNPSSYGVYIRKAQRLTEAAREPELFDHAATQPCVLEPVLESFGVVVEHDYLDCPWWPDLFVPTGERLLEASLKRIPMLGRRLGERLAAGSEDPYRYGPESFPLFAGVEGHEALVSALKRHPVFDGDRPRALKTLFGHHHAYLVEKAGARAE